jgi:SNF2 family DNA or RNA helicase
VADFLAEAQGPEANEWVIHVAKEGQTVSPRVRLWPLDLDWQCDCGEKEDPCVHVVAAIQAQKQGLWKEKDAGTHLGIQHAGEVNYHFVRRGDALELERRISFGQEETPLPESLAGYIAGMQSGRYSIKKMAATKTDFAIDHLLKDVRGSTRDSRLLAQVLPLIKKCRGVFLDGNPILIGDDSVWQPRLVVLNRGTRYRMSWFQENLRGEEIFSNGCFIQNGSLYMGERNLGHGSNACRAWVERDLMASEFYNFMCLHYDSLSEQIPIQFDNFEAPRWLNEEPRILFRTEIMNDYLHVYCELAYGEPLLARGFGNQWELVSEKEWPRRDLGKEQAIIRKLQQILHLPLGRLVKLKGDDGARCQQSIEKFNDEFNSRFSKSLKSLTSSVSIKKSVDEIPPWGLSWSNQGNESWSVDVVYNGDDASSSSSQRWTYEHVQKQVQEGREYIFCDNSDSWVPLPRQWLSSHSAALTALIETRDDKRLSSDEKAFVASGVAEELGLELSPHIRKLRDEAMGSLDNFEVSLPTDLVAKLRPYQEEGVRWLQWRQKRKLGALLADDMGLGKTLQALCTFGQRSLVVAPTSLLQTWREQIQRFRPGLNVSVYHGSQRRWSSTGNVVITSYHLLRQELAQFTQEKWETIVLDEAQYIKNIHSQIAQSVHQLSADFRIALSGTPVENHWGELWSLFQFINPGLLGAYDTFQERMNSQGARFLQARVKPFVLRREKRVVAKELPQKTESILRVELSEEERHLYEAIQGATREEIMRQMDSGGNVISLLEAILRLRQVCCHGGLVPGHDSIVTSTKVQALSDHLETIIEEGHKALVFSQWTGYLDRIAQHLSSLGLKYLRLDGSTRDRQKVVDEFQNEGRSQILLISLKAGGVGLNLTAADHVFIMDPWWNPAVELQAADRAHRLGQENPVFVYKFIAVDTIEERILLLQEQKRQLAYWVLDGTSTAQSLTREDILALLD